jgi:hypothetical protein
MRNAAALSTDVNDVCKEFDADPGPLYDEQHAVDYDPEAAAMSAFVLPKVTPSLKVGLSAVAKEPISTSLVEPRLASESRSKIAGVLCSTASAWQSPITANAAATATSVDTDELKAKAILVLGAVEQFVPSSRRGPKASRTLPDLATNIAVSEASQQCGLYNDTNQNRAFTLLACTLLRGFLRQSLPADNATDMPHEAAQALVALNKALANGSQSPENQLLMFLSGAWSFSCIFFDLLYQFFA